MLTDQLNELWSESLGDEDFRFELKAQQVAVDLAEVFARTNLTQQELADRLGWKKSRVSKVLHGATNLTLRTLFQMSEAMDSDFQVVFGDKLPSDGSLTVEGIWRIAYPYEEWHEEIVPKKDAVRPQSGKVIRMFPEIAYG